jgi:competence protein ComEC
MWAIVIDETVASPYRLHFIDVGTGLAVFVEARDFAVLYDGGSNDDLKRGVSNRLLAYLRHVSPNLRVIDHLILSHPHRDHVELLPDVFDAYQVRNVWDSGRVNATCGYRAFLEKTAAEAGVAYHDALPHQGLHNVPFKAQRCYGSALPAATVSIPHASQISSQLVPLGQGARMQFLHADGGEHGSENENSLVVRLELGNRRILLTGDAEAGGRQPPSSPPHPQSIEGKLLACCSALLKSDILVVGHHGSMTSSRTRFLDSVEANAFVVSTGPKKYASVTLPDQVVIDELSRRGTVWRTDLTDVACRGAIKVGPDNDGRPGGCDNIRAVITEAGALNIQYDRNPD